MQRRQALTGIVAAAACASLPARADVQQADLRAFRSEINRHIAPYELVGPTQLDGLLADAEKRTAQGEAAAALAFQRMVGAVGDLHTTVSLPELLALRLPLQLQAFDEGWFVTAASLELADLLGMRVLRIGGSTPEQLHAEARAFAAYPLEAEFDAHFRRTLVHSGALYQHLRLAGDQVELTMTRGLDKGLRTALVPLTNATPTVTEVAAGLRPGLAIEQSPERNYHVLTRAVDASVVVVYRRCNVDPTMSISQLANAARQSARDVSARRAVIDMRGNGGGDSSLLLPVIAALRELSALRAQGAIRVLTNAGTQSSALLNAFSLRQDFGAIVVGEIAGTALNHFGEVRQLTLPSGRRMTYSSRRFTLAPNDARGRMAALDPDLAARPSWVAMRVGADVVLEAALAL